jgi:hypothetical protein
LKFDEIPLNSGNRAKCRGQLKTGGRFWIFLKF